MNLEPDYQRDIDFKSEDNKKRSGIMWVFIILIGVFLGNVLSYGTYEIYNYWKLKMIMEAASTALEKQQFKLSEKRKIQERKNIAHQQELRKESAINSQLEKTCTFWRQQVKRENTAKNRSNRDLACSRLNGSFR